MLEYASMRCINIIDFKKNTKYKNLIFFVIDFRDI